MPAPKGNKNAKGNKGGGAPVMQDRELAARVRSLALGEIEAVLKDKETDYEFYKAVLIKLAGSVLPRLNEHTGEGGEPIEQRIIYLPQRNDGMETASGKTD